MWASIRKEGIWEAKAFVYVVDVVQGSLCGIDSFVARYRYYPLSRSMVDHDHKAVGALAWGKISNEVAGDLGEGKGVLLRFDRNESGCR